MKTHSAFIYQGQIRNRVQKLCLVNFSFQTNLHTKRKTALHAGYLLYQHLEIWGRRIMSSSNPAWDSKWDLILKQKVYGEKSFRKKKTLVCDSRKHSIVQYSNEENRNALKIGMQHTLWYGLRFRPSYFACWILHTIKENPAARDQTLRRCPENAYGTEVELLCRKH